MNCFKHVLLAASMVSLNALAEDYKEDYKWGLGLGAVATDNGYEDVDFDTNVVPVVYVETENFYLLGPYAAYKIGALGDWEFTLLGQYRFDGYEQDDEDIFAGMEERENTIDLGFEIEYETDYGDFSLAFLADAGNKHEGYEASLTYAVPIRLSHSRVTPYLTISQHSKDLVDYYYGVRLPEATSTRPEYSGDATTNFEIGVNTTWEFGRHHRFVGNLQFTSLGSDIKDSPLVDTSNATTLIFGYVYVF